MVVEIEEAHGCVNLFVEELGDEGSGVGEADLISQAIPNILE